MEKREVTREDYYQELSSLGVKGARRKRLRSEYFSLLGRISGIAREERRITARIPWVGIITKVVMYDRIRDLDRERERLLTQMRHIRTTELPVLNEEIASELREFKQKIKPPPPPPVVVKLHRIKIRLYNMQRAPTPTGMFQGFFDVDAIIDPETEMVDWEWWLTQEEIAIAKYHFVGYFKGMAKWRGPDQVSLAYFDDPEGIMGAEETAKYKYSKKVPGAFITKAQVLTVGELIVGESSQEPEPNLDPTAENMGVYSERFMIIDKDGGIKWDEIRERWIWHPTNSMVNRVKEELD